MSDVSKYRQGQRCTPALRTMERQMQEYYKIQAILSSESLSLRPERSRGRRKETDIRLLSQDSVVGWSVSPTILP